MKPAGWLLLAFIGTVRAEPVALDVQPVPFHDPAAGAPVAELRVHGMLELPSLTHRGFKLSQLSALAWDDDDGLLYALSDKGVLFHLRPHFRRGELAGLTLVHTAPLLHPATGKPLRGRDADAEGLDIVNGRNGRRGDAVLLVSFERRARIVRYRPNGKALDELRLPERLRDPARYRSGNGMLEAVCRDPVLGVLTAPEHPLKPHAETEGAVYALNGRRWYYRRESYTRLTALECLGGGEVLLLENRFGRLSGTTRVFLRRLKLSAGPVAEELQLITLDRAKGYQLDNFEGLARHRGNRFFLVSDNNDLFVQRTLLLYVEVTDSGGKPARR